MNAGFYVDTTNRINFLISRSFKKEVILLGRGSRTAKEIKQFAVFIVNCIVFYMLIHILISVVEINENNKKIVYLLETAQITQLPNEEY